MRRKIGRQVSAIAILLTLAMLLSTASAFAKGPGGGSSGGRGNRGGGGSEETVPNNLSVPAIFAGVTTNSFGLTCDGTTLNMPTGTPANGYPLDPATYYYLQGTSPWQAQCAYSTTATATADWGDNLTGAASLRVGAPIRVEVGLLEGTLAGDVTTPSVSMTGFNVYKLEPDALDRVSAYGTPATPDSTSPTGFSGIPVPSFTEVRVYDPTATVKLTDPAGSTTTLNVTAEINATGRIVYGYNLTVATAGEYTLTFNAPNVTLNNPDSSTDVHTASLKFTVASSSGGGGGGGKGRP